MAEGKTQQADVDAKKQAFADVAGKMGDATPTCRASLAAGSGSACWP